MRTLYQQWVDERRLVVTEERHDSTFRHEVGNAWEAVCEGALEFITGESGGEH